jgi:hypothetical protein
VLDVLAALEHQDAQAALGQLLGRPPSGDADPTTMASKLSDDCVISIPSWRHGAPASCPQREHAIELCERMERKKCAADQDPSLRLLDIRSAPGQ